MTSSPNHTQVVLERLKAILANISLTCKGEENCRLGFLEVLLKRRMNGKLSRSVNRKPTCAGQYIHFHSFCSSYCKRALVRTLFNGVRRICKPDSLEHKFGKLSSVPSVNSYPKNFIRRFQQLRETKPEIYLAERKRVFIELPYKGEQTARITRQRLRNAIGRAYNATELGLIHKTKPLPVSSHRL